MPNQQTPTQKTPPSSPLSPSPKPTSFAPTPKPDTASTASPYARSSATPSSSTERTSPRKEEPASTPQAVAGAVKHAAEGAAEVVQEVRDVVVDSYHAGTEYLGHKAQQVEETAGDLVDTVATQAARTARSTRGFVGSNLLPLLVVGTGLTWLALRMLGQSPRPAPRAPASPRPLPGEPRTRVPTLAREGQPLSAATPAGTKLIGVRVHDTGYLE